MRELGCFFLALILVMLVGCSNTETTNYNYTFKGENDSWTAEYKVVGTVTWSKADGKLHYESEATKVLTVTYKGDAAELSSVRYLELSYDTGAGGGKFAENYDSENPLSQKVFTFRSEGKGQSIPYKDEVIEVRINLDGNEQTIELKNVD